ncbi:MAG: zf-HC2 domain-containing protein [Vicinamibacterales bacterium]
MTHTEAVNSLASERYLLDEMSEPERDAFEAHFFECAECAEDITASARMQEGVKAGLLQAPHIARVATFTPAPKTPARNSSTAPGPVPAAPAWYRSAVLPWAVAATLAVVVGYQAADSGIRSATRAGAIEMVSPVLLRPASRGAAPAAPLGRPYVALALDVDASGTPTVSYELRDATGSTLTSGQNPAPVAGAPLLLVIPSFTLAPNQRYSLTVRDAANPTRTLGEYAFATTP